MKLTFAIYAGIFIALTLTVACSKDDAQKTYEPPPQAQIDDTVHSFVFGCDTALADTNINYIRHYHFGKKTAPGQVTGYYKKIAEFYPSDKGFFELRYLPAIKIYSPNELIDRTPNSATFNLPSALRNKPIFEVYVNNKLVKRITAAADSVTVGTYSYHGWIDEFQTAREICETFNGMIGSQRAQGLRYEGSISY